MAVYAIGDLHGALEKLRSLLRHIGDASHLVFLGDYLDKGPHSHGVIDFVRVLATSVPCTFLMGNHEFVWLRHLDGEDRSQFLKRLGGREALGSYLGHDMSEDEFGTLLSDRMALRRLFGDHLAFMRGLASFAAPKGVGAVCVHGGIARGFGDEDLARHDVEKLLFLRIGRDATERPWRGRTIVCGHTVVGRIPMVRGATIGIDTGAWMPDGRLTALDLATLRYVQDDETTGEMRLSTDAAV